MCWSEVAVSLIISICRPVKEKIEGHNGIYTKTNRLYRKSITVREFRTLANKAPFPKGKVSPEEVEKYGFFGELQ